ncbi:MAG: hypothetical protein CFK49_00855 [Armatimonadetes bacterium JP3_11]|nr:MAG: hypothetical protein CFK49_00855 [Armatimonadetes bacterium JP3_11]
MIRVATSPAQVAKSQLPHKSFDKDRRRYITCQKINASNPLMDDCASSRTPETAIIMPVRRSKPESCFVGRSRRTVN